MQGPLLQELVWSCTLLGTNSDLVVLNVGLLRVLSDGSLLQFSNKLL